MNRDADHLRLLSIFHFVYAALIAFYASFGLIYIGMGTFMMPMLQSEIKNEVKKQQAAAKAAKAKEEADATVVNEDGSKTEIGADDASDQAGPAAPNAGSGPAVGPTAPPEAVFSFMSWIMVFMGTVTIVLGFFFAFANAFAGRCLVVRKHRLLCLLVAGFNCVNVPLGTILGIFTLIVLLRPSVENLFAGVIEAE